MSIPVDSVLDAAFANIGSLPNDTLIYGINITNSTNVLGKQVGDSYHTIITDDSAITSSNTHILSSGGIERVPNLLKFKLPNFFKLAFAIASFMTEPTDATRYIRGMLDYGIAGASQIELARIASGYYNSRSDHTVVMSYAGLAPASDESEIYFDFLSYQEQQFFGANILIGVML